MLNMGMRPSRGGMLAGLVSGDGIMPSFPRVTRREFGAHDAPGRPGGVVQDAVQPGLDGLPPPLDSSPYGLPPANAPGGQDLTPLQPARPDYAALLRESLGPRPELHGFRKFASILGPALMAATGNQAGANQMIESLRAPQDDYDRQSRALGMEAIKWRRDDDLAQQKRNEPTFFSGNEDRVRFDPATGMSTRVYNAPQDFEDYAATSGHEPGTPEYFNAVQDYVLKGNGPGAFKYDRDLEAIKNAQRITLETERQRNRSALRGMPNYRDTHPAPPRASGPRSKARPTATGPNGQRMEYDGTAWVPAR